MGENTMSLELNLKHIESLIDTVGYQQTGLSTICTIKTKQNIVIYGQSHALREATYDAEIGKKVAYDNAIDQLFEKEGYRIKFLENS